METIKVKVLELFKEYLLKNITFKELIHDLYTIEVNDLWDNTTKGLSKSLWISDETTNDSAESIEGLKRKLSTNSHWRKTEVWMKSLVDNPENLELNYI